MRLVPLQESWIPEIMRWFPDQRSCAIWSGPQFRFPFSLETFREDMRPEVPSFCLQGDEMELLGFGQHYLRAERCHLARLVIAPERRGRGHGATLIRELSRRGCAELNVETCSLFVLADNVSAVRLYTRLGFTAMPYPGEPPPFECLYMVASRETVGSWQGIDP